MWAAPLCGLESQTERKANRAERLTLFPDGGYQVTRCLK